MDTIRWLAASLSLAGSDQLHVGETRMRAGADQCEVDSGRSAGISIVGFAEPPPGRRAGHPDPARRRQDCSRAVGRAGPPGAPAPVRDAWGPEPASEKL